MSHTLITGKGGFLLLGRMVDVFGHVEDHSHESGGVGLVVHSS